MFYHGNSISTKKERNKDMKATYQKPAIELLSAYSLEHLLEGSGGLLGDGDNPKDLDLGNTSTTDATGGNLSRRRSVWSDGAEDDEF